MIQLVLFLLLIPSLAFGASTLPPGTQLETLNDFSGGLNTSVSPQKIPKNMSPNLQNVLIDEVPSSVVRSPGYIVVGSTGLLSKINFTFDFVKANGDSEFIVSDGSIVATTSDFQNYTILKTNLTNTSLLDAAQGRGKVWFTNGSDPVFTYDGSTVVVLDGQTYGTLATPNVPRSRYVEYFEDRFFLYVSSVNKSALSWSIAVGTDDVIFAPDDVRAWDNRILANQLNIGDRDGQSGTGLWAYLGQLRASKDSSIYTIFRVDQYTYFARKTSVEEGVNSNDSIAILDNKTYSFNKNAINEFTGNDSNRISDAIVPDVEAVTSNLTNIVENKWDTQAQFDKGTFSNTTTTPNGLLYLQNQTVVSSMAVPPSIDLANAWTAKLSVIDSSLQNSSSSIFNTVSPQLLQNDNGNFSYGEVYGATVGIRATGSAAAPNPITITFRNSDTGLLADCYILNNGTPFDDTITSANVCITTTPFTVTRSDILNSKLQVRVAVDTANWSPGSSIWISSIGVPGRGGILMRSNTGQFISEVTTTAATVNFWDTFLTNDSPNGALINYFIHNATHSTSISTVPYTQIFPGSVIGASVTFNRFQWATTITAITNQLPYIDWVSVRHNEGNSSDSRPFATSWKNRYWLAVTTQIGSNYPILYVKSKITNSNPNAFVKITGIPIRSFGKFKDNFYAGSSTAGVIMRLDYGENYNGSAIESFYETPEMNFGSTFIDKNFYGYLIDADQDNSLVYKVGSYSNGGAISEINLSMDGSGRGLKVIRGVNPKSKYLKLRLYNNQLDMTFKFHEIGILNEKTSIFPY